MKLLYFLLYPCRSVTTFCRILKEKIVFHHRPETGRLALIMATLFVLFVFFSPFGHPNLPIDFQAKAEEFSLPTLPERDPHIPQILSLANVIRLVAEVPVSENKSIRYAGLIWHASQKFGVKPLEIVALITAESGFKEKSVNSKSGDYGLGQINWVHWGKEHGLSPQDLMDPAINIFLTCWVFKFFGEDFGKYHRGNGIISQAYVVNVKSILSALKIYTEMESKKTS